MHSLPGQGRQRWLAVLIGLCVLAACAVPAPGGPPVSTPGSVAIKLLAFTDFHGHLQPEEGGTLDWPNPATPGTPVRIGVGGAAYLASLVAQRRALNPNTLVLSAGDLIGATRLSSALFRDEPTIEAMNLIGLDANAVGNHEFDKGRDELDRIVKGGCRAPRADDPLSSCEGRDGAYAGARFRFLAANVLDAGGQPIHPPYLIRRFGPVEVGVIGVVTRTAPTIVSPTGIAGLRFEDEALTINRAVRELQARGIEAIVVVMHEGGTAGPGEGECQNARGEGFGIVDRLDPAVDLVIAGHTHQAYNCLRQGIRVVQAGANGRLLAEIDLQVDTASRDVRRDSVSARLLPVVNGLGGAGTAAPGSPAVVGVPGGPAALPADPAVATLVGHYAALAGPRIQREVGRITEAFTRRSPPGTDHPAGRLVADAQLAATRDPARGGAQIAFMNPGGIRTDLTPGNAQGVVTYGDVFGMQPFGNSLVTLSLTGVQIRALLEQQWSGINAAWPRVLHPSKGFSYAWRASAAPGERVVADSMRLNGQPIEAQRVYRVTVNSFLAEGADGFSVLRQGTERVGGLQDIDALLAWLKQNSPASPDPQARVTRLD